MSLVGRRRLQTSTRDKECSTRPHADRDDHRWYYGPSTTVDPAPLEPIQGLQGSKGQRGLLCTIKKIYVEFVYFYVYAYTDGN